MGCGGVFESRSLAGIRLRRSLAGAALLVSLTGCGRNDSIPGSASGSSGNATSSSTPDGTSSGKPSAKRGPCGDERDEIIKAYKDLGIGMELGCNDFTRARHTEHFAFSDLAGKGNYRWALLRDPLLAGKDRGYGLDLWRENFGGARQINSAYRDPVHNKKQGGAKRSRHMFGDAADVRNVTRSREEWERMWTAAQKAEADYIEPLSGPCKLNCLHADWRNHDGAYKQ